MKKKQKIVKKIRVQNFVLTILIRLKKKVKKLKKFSSVQPNYQNQTFWFLLKINKWNMRKC